jgi:hypothetical protein
MGELYHFLKFPRNTCQALHVGMFRQTILNILDNFRVLSLVTAVKESRLQTRFDVGFVLLFETIRFVENLMWYDRVSNLNRPRHRQDQTGNPLFSSADTWGYNIYHSRIDKRGLILEPLVPHWHSRVPNSGHQQGSLTSVMRQAC